MRSLPRGPAAATAIDCVLLALAVLVVGLLTGAFGGSIKGYDGWGHLSKIELVLRHFPSVDWNYDWYSGSPFFLGGYPPLFYYLAAALVVAGTSAAAAMNALMAASYVVMTLSLYGLVRIATGRRVAGYVAALLLLASPVVWTHLVQAGLYPRVFGMGFVSLSVMFAVVYLRKPSGLRYLAMVASMVAALSSHVVLGAIALATVFLVLLLVPDGAGRARPLRAALAVPPLIVASYYYLPLVFYPQPQSPLTGVDSAVSLGTLLIPGDSIPYGLSAILLPAALLALTVWLRTHNGESPSATWLIVVCGLICAALLAYAVLPLPTRVYALRSVDMLFFLSWFVAAIAGLAVGLSRLRTRFRWESSAAAAMVAIAVLAIVSAVPTVIKWTVNASPNPVQVTAGWQPIDPAERSFRVASPSDNLSVWLNGVYDVPQTRGYGAALQVLNPDQQYWLDNTGWSSAASDEQRNFLLDWYAVAWLYVPVSYMPSTAGVIPKLLARPDLYQAVPSVDGQPSSTFLYVRRTPIASATNATTALVVGGPYDYNLVFRDFSYSDLGSGTVIPVRAHNYIDDYSAADLAVFDEIVLYGFQFHDQARAAKLLSDYVMAGGGLIVEAGGSAFDHASGIPDPLPVTETARYQVNGDWRFASAVSPATDGINFAAFGEASYKGGPWTVSAATGVKSWARPVLFSDGRPVVVLGQLGKGHVMWSGLNLPYHIDSFRNSEESRFFGKAIAWTARSHDSGATSFSASVDGPQQTTISVATPARGMLFKESFFRNWHAYVGGHEVTLYPAGPGFMYAQMPSATEYPAVVVFRYEKSPVDLVGIAISVIAGIALLTMFAWLRLAVPWMRSASSRLSLGVWNDPDE